MPAEAVFIDSKYYNETVTQVMNLILSHTFLIMTELNEELPPGIKNHRKQFPCKEGR
jgi:hypothetical protein